MEADRVHLKEEGHRPGSFRVESPGIKLSWQDEEDKKKFFSGRCYTKSHLGHIQDTSRKIYDIALSRLNAPWTTGTK